MARPKDPAVRAALLGRAAQLLRTRDPVTLRSVVAGSGTSTMAVYTHFGGMDGLWRALRQEGFTRLAEALGAAPVSADPVRDLAALAAAYLRNALDHPDLYRVMFDPGFALDDPGAAEDPRRRLVLAAARAREAGRLAAATDPEDLATRTWVVSHGLASLVATGPLPTAALAHGAPLLTALFVGAGDHPDRCRPSVEAGWQVPAE